MDPATKINTFQKSQIPVPAPASTSNSGVLANINRLCTASSPTPRQMPHLSERHPSGSANLIHKHASLSTFPSTHKRSEQVHQNQPSPANANPSLHHAHSESEIIKPGTSVMKWEKYNDIQLSNISGIQTVWIPIFKRVSKEYNCIIGCRPVSEDGRKSMASGLPTKDMRNGKGKSSDGTGILGHVGPAHGHICVNQRFSKVNDQKKADDLTKKVQESLDKGVESGDLILPQWRMQDLKEEGTIFHELNSGVLKLSPPKEIRGETFIAVPISNSEEDLKAIAPFTDGTVCNPKSKEALTVNDRFYRILHANKPLQVVCEGGLPITADIDLFELAFPLEEHGPDDKLPIPDTTEDNFLIQRKKYSTEQLTKVSRKKFYEDEIPGKGNASRQLLKMLNILNKSLGRTDRPVIHHNIDSTSPASDLDSNFPGTFFLPPRIQEILKSDHIVINNPEELKAFYQIAKDAAYGVHLNPKWGKEWRMMRRDSFTQSMTIFNNL